MRVCDCGGSCCAARLLSSTCASCFHTACAGRTALALLSGCVLHHRSNSTSCFAVTAQPVVCGAGCVCASTACLWMHRTMVCMHPFRLELASNVSTARHKLACAYHLSLRLVVAGAVKVLETFCLPCCTVHTLFGAAALSCLPCSGSTRGVWVARRSSLCDSVHATTKKVRVKARLVMLWSFL